MAQLPPKVPSIAPNWPNLGHQRTPSMGLFNASINDNNNSNSWVDEFLDFSATKRRSHRRSVSDSVAFLEDPSGFDEDQLMYLFSDDVAPPVNATSVPGSSSNPSSPSDHNSINEEKVTNAEVQSECKVEMQGANNVNGSESILDPKRVKRILANRQSAQRSRVRKLQYISELERSVTALQMEVSALSPRVAFLDHQRSVLTMGNSHLKQRIAALAQDKIFKDGKLFIHACSSRSTKEGDSEVEASLPPAEPQEYVCSNVGIQHRVSELSQLSMDPPFQWKCKLPYEQGYVYYLSS